jgi:hypothetical protein
MPPLPRAAYYYIALFILASTVRYEPEMLVALVNPDSPLGWMVERFLNSAERFFPHLVLHWLFTEPVFF